MLAARISESKQAVIKYGWEFLTTRAAKKFWYRGWSKLTFYDSRSCGTSLLESGVRILSQMHALISKSPPSILSLESGKYCKMYFHTTALIVSVAAPPQGALGRELGDMFPLGLLSLGPLWLGAGSGLLGLWHSTTLSTALLSKSLPGRQHLEQLFEEKAWLLS